MATTYLTRTPSSTGNLRTFTISFWVKKCLTIRSGSTSQQIIGQTNEQYFRLMFLNSTDQFRFYDQAGLSKKTNRLFSDPNSWYHFCVRIDTTQSAATNRARLYVNGVEETSFETNTNPGLNVELHFNRQQIHSIGRSSSSGGYDFIVIDGQSLGPTSFAETDTDTGEWKPKQLADDAFTWGTNGFRILKDGMTVTDQSTNSNNWTAYGSLRKTEDAPSNVFATGNPLDTPYTNYTFSNGNNTLASTTGNGYTFSTATLGMTSGKYYWEAKAVSKSAGIDNWVIGFTSASAVNSTTVPGALVTGYGMYASSGVIYNAGSTAYGVTYGVGDIIGIALDLDNLKAYWSKNGVWVSSANPSANSGGYTITAPVGNIGAYVPAWSWYEDSNTGQTSYNFGNGYFGTTAVSSAGTNASNNGIFEYDVPTGYTALSTKGLNQ
jgi:hypothetical protein